MKYAVIKMGGKQYRVSEGDEILVDNLDQEEGKNIDLAEVLLFANEDQREIGDPYLKNVTVKAKVGKNIKGEKVITAKYKAKSRYRKVTGYRHLYTSLVIEKINSSNQTLTRVKK